MKREDIMEKELHPASGLLMLFVTILGLFASIAVIVIAAVLLEYGLELLGGLLIVLGILCCLLFPVMMCGLKTVRPNEARVLLLFGNLWFSVSKPLVSELETIGFSVSKPLVSDVFLRGLPPR